MNSAKIITGLFAPGAKLLGALEIVQAETETSGTLHDGVRADVLAELEWPRSGERKRFVVEVKGQSTPKSVLDAIYRVKADAAYDQHPLIAVPYLSDERIQMLEEKGVSGVDLCGNGIIIADNWFVKVTGNKNEYRTSRPLQSPYAGKSALVGHLLLAEPRWQAVTQLHAAIEERGGKLSLSQVSKALKALEQDLVIDRRNGITLTDPQRLLKGLAHDYQPLRKLRGCYLRTDNSPVTWIEAFNQTPDLIWAVTGETAADFYGLLSQTGPTTIVVRDHHRAVQQLKETIHATDEPIRNFASIEVIESDDPAPYFNNRDADNGTPYASEVQTWLELQNGDTRQLEAAAILRDRMIERLQGAHHD